MAKQTSRPEFVTEFSGNLWLFNIWTEAEETITLKFSVQRVADPRFPTRSTSTNGLFSTLNFDFDSVLF